MGQVGAALGRLVLAQQNGLWGRLVQHQDDWLVVDRLDDDIGACHESTILKYELMFQQEQIDSLARMNQEMQDQYQMKQEQIDSLIKSNQEKDLCSLSVSSGKEKQEEERRSDQISCYPPIFLTPNFQVILCGRNLGRADPILV